MNISQPVASSVESVEFTFLSTEEIRAASVRRIENDSTFDTLLNPVPGGLYDPALGSWGDSLCTTCNLGQSLCPGHAGHIDLPVPVYHPVFMDQVLRLLRAECSYCHHFRLPVKELNRYICKLRLLQFGLLTEAMNIDAIGEDYRGLAVPGLPQIDVECDDDSTSLMDGVSRARSAYVLQVLQNKKVFAGDIRKGKHEGSSELRRELIQQFLKDIVVGRQCARCKGLSPSYRKDRFIKIFEKPLNSKEQAKMAAGQFKMRDALTLRPKNRRSAASMLPDEGIADISLDSASDDNGELDEPADELDEYGNVVHKPYSDNSASSHVPQQRYISTQEVLERLRLLFTNEQDILQLIYSSRPQARGAVTTPDMFFIHALLVPPNKYRPEARTGDAQVTEAQQNSLYKAILGASFKVADIHREISQATAGRRDILSLHEAWSDLQNAVNSLIDCTKNPVQGQNAKRIEDGIKQKLEKKEGLFRKNMMGKRVNFAARSVISPDPNIETNEIGVPPVFARKLTYPEPVTSHNFKELQQAVINGTDVWPGASAIENENGQVVNLRGKSLEDRMALANQLLAPSSNGSFSNMRGKKVYRHLSNGDVVLMNRQPTLHKPSIMGHRVRVLPGEKTIRMHYANCNTYNADFDGDEMNMHFPQNEIARVEALQLADTDHQYLSGTQGKPLRGLIQDHISISVSLCSKDTFFHRGTYQDLIYSALRPESGHILGDRIELVSPAILKPVPRWTGKQVITTILKNIKPPNCGHLWMSGKSQVPGNRWGSHKEEGMVEFRDSVLISGILDKAHLGPSSGGFIHAVHEVYGPSIAGKVLSCMGRLLTRLLNMQAFTCGMDDLRLTPEGEINHGSLVQFLYGEDGLDVTKQKYLTDFSFVLHNLQSEMSEFKFSDPRTAELFEHKDEFSKQTKRMLKKAGTITAFADEPVNALVNPAKHAFAMSEKFFSAMSSYVRENKDHLIKGKDTTGDEHSATRLLADQASMGKRSVERVFAAKYLRSQVEPGEAVGIVAGQSVGEPSTQMTLNTFHLAGHSAKNVTLGIPRLREILMTASAKISTPAMTLVLQPHLTHEQGEDFAKTIGVLPLSHVIDKITVKERVAGVVEVARADAEDENSAEARGDDDSDDDEGDNDATSAKQRANRNEAVSYGPNDEDDDDIQMRMEREVTADEDLPDDEGYVSNSRNSASDKVGSGAMDSSSDSESSGDEGEGDPMEDVQGSTGRDAAKARQARVKGNNTHVTRFRSDEKSGEWCEFTLELSADTPKILMLSVVEDAVRRSVVRQIAGVKSCTFVADETVKNMRTGVEAKVPVVHTEGTNIRAMQQYSDYFDPNQLATNDIVAMLEMYGVEACRNTIIRELSTVFVSHGIGVDNRHLNLIGDFMTRGGGFMPFNRYGLKGNVSPFTKMSFETTLAFLKDALVDGDWDGLVTPSSRIVMGRLGKTGTGAFDVLTRVPMEHFDPMQVVQEV
ncbi:hypothetical protein SCUCBS95973_003589 [Sporothrix curviconia]|uniref:DNA-directed RNA polymerase subunit n=1 Tax=Sporothrix curviconia TaxID=1260050 RepID=A0ABP0BGW1_9PEZI